MHYKAVWLSDLLLGTRGYDAPGLLDILRQKDSERRCFLDELEPAS